MFDIWFLKAVFVPLCFWLFSWLKLIQTLQFGGVSESSRSPLHDGHRDFKNWSRDAWENWSWSWHQKHRHHFFAILSISKWGLAASTSIFSGISALIFKISVPIIKRRSWGIQNTPNLLNLMDLMPSYCHSKNALCWANWWFSCILNSRVPFLMTPSV